MTIIKKATQEEKDWFKHAKQPPKKLNGKVLLTLYEEFGIGGGFAAELAAYFLGYNKQTLQAMVSPKWSKTKGIRYNDYMLLRRCLTEWKVTRMSKETEDLRYGEVREDGKRHHKANYAELPEKHRIESKERMRAGRLLDPMYGRSKK